MCGIAGIICAEAGMVTLGKLKEMTDVISHRGPDGEGRWISSNGNVGLGHRRLSIIDLSHEADQPMHYMQRYTIVFNGEIYNYIELKEILLKQGYQFQTESDTEVLIALFDRDGEDFLKLLDGMFSLVIYDAKTNSIFCARDRFGEKPFYYSYKDGEYFYFGSEIKCFWAVDHPKEINQVMLYNYIQHGYLKNPDNTAQTFYNNINELPPSSSLKIDVKNIKVSIQQYYDIDWKYQDDNITEEEAIDKFKKLLYTSIKRRMRSDVTLGSSLSGGLDSSAIVTIISKININSGQKQETFSAVFPGYLKDERKYMDFVFSKVKNINPHFVTPSETGLNEDLKKLLWHQDEPFGSASIYAQYCVMKLAKQNTVTVLLDGQGADEILAGYHLYYKYYFQELKEKKLKIYKEEYDEYKKVHRNNSINRIQNHSIKEVLKEKFPAVTNRLRKLKDILFEQGSTHLAKGFKRNFEGQKFTHKSKFESLNEILYYHTMQSGALQQLLRYADRNSMAHSVEVRLPFLNHELVEFIFSLPANFKIRKGWNKWIMRQSLGEELPSEIAWRKDKIGYEPPQKDWLNSEQITKMLNDSQQFLVMSGILNKKILEKNAIASNSDYYWRYLMANQFLACDTKDIKYNSTSQTAEGEK